jgi:multidrug efflux pump subunit AcrB
MFTETEPRVGDSYGQVFVSLNPKSDTSRDVDEIMGVLREALQDAPASAKVSLLKLSGGPPSAKAVSIKIKGDDYALIREAAKAITHILEQTKGVKDITTDAAIGSNQLITHLNMNAIRAAGLDAGSIIRTLKILADGEVIAQLSDKGEKVDLRIRSNTTQVSDIEAWLITPIATASGGYIPLGECVSIETATGYASLRHHNYRRAITLEADLDKTLTDTLAANQEIKLAWQAIASDYPSISLDFSGELDDLNESLGSMGMLFIMGIGLMYLILGAQFKSYKQPLIILFTVPMAFTGVAFGLWLGNIPLSLYTLYGVVALSGIAVNSAIVLIAAANDRRNMGMSILHASVYAARRRLVPILITSSTTVMGLLGLALGIGGYSLIFGPVATAIVWGIMISTLLTLFTIPLLYRLTSRKNT